MKQLDTERLNDQASLSDTRVMIVLDGTTGDLVTVTQPDTTTRQYTYGDYYLNFARNLPLRST